MILFHATESRNRGEILERGLLPRDPVLEGHFGGHRFPREEWQPRGVYAFTSVRTALHWVSNWEPRYRGPFDVWSFERPRPRRDRVLRHQSAEWNDARWVASRVPPGDLTLAADGLLALPRTPTVPVRRVIYTVRMA